MDVVWIPSTFAAKVNLDLVCLSKAKTFKQICQCSMNAEENCQFQEVQLEQYKHTINFDTVVDIGSLEFDSRVLYLPSYNVTFVMFEMACLAKVQNMVDLCKCQLKVNNPNCELIEEKPRLRNKDPNESTTLRTSTEGQSLVKCNFEQVISIVSKASSALFMA